MTFIVEENDNICTIIAPIKEIERELTKHSGRKPEMIARIGGVTASNIGPDLVGIMIRRKSDI